MPTPVFAIPKPAPEMIPEKVALPPLTDVRTADLLNVMLPLKVETSAVLPPSVAVPLLPEATVTALAKVRAPAVNRLAFAEPVLSPNVTAAADVPNAPLVVLT